MANETEVYKLDLDNADFNKKAEASKTKVKELGSDENLNGLIEGLKTGSKILGVLGTVALAAKTALDLSLQAEHAKIIGVQFDLLTKNVGVSGSKIKESLLSIADGLEEEGNILKVANQGVVALGANASRLPEIFELAKQATTAFGGDLLENFTRFNEAIASGRTMSLKQYGLIIDSDKAYRDYAASVGVTVAALSDQERKTAILNAVLDSAKMSYQGITDETLKVSNSLSRLTHSLGQLKEDAAIAFDGAFGSYTQKILQGANDIVKDMSRFLVAKFGEGPSAARAQFERLSDEMRESEETVVNLQQKIKTLGNLYGNLKNYTSDYQNAVRALAGEEKRLAELREEVAKQKALVDSDDAKIAEEEASRTVAIDESAIAKRAEIASKFAADLAALRMNRINGELEVAQTVEQVELLQEQRQQTLLQLLLAREEQIKAAVLNRTLTEQQAELQLDEVRKASIAEMRKVEQRAEEERLKALQNLANATRFTTDGFANGFKAAAATASRDMGNFAKMGETAFNSFSNNASKAFLALGQGTEKASDIMKGFFLNALADIAEAQGKIMLANIFNPAAVAAGAGLLILAGFLRSKAPSGGGESLGAEIPASGATGDSGAGVRMSSAADYERPEVEEARRRREVQVIIQGNYLETPEVQRTLLEMIRSETDATGFSYVQIGQGA